MNTPTPKSNSIIVRLLHDKLNTFNSVASKLAADLVNHAEKLERELAAAREELTQAYAKLDRILNLTIHDDLWWAIEEIARISGGESDSLPNSQDR